MSDDQPVTTEDIEDGIKRAGSPRNFEMCRQYMDGTTLDDCAVRFGVSRERVRQILRKAGVFKRDRFVEKSQRDHYIGINVSEASKEGLKDLAERQGVSVSRLASDTLERMLKEDES